MPGSKTYSPYSLNLLQSTPSGGVSWPPMGSRASAFMTPGLLAAMIAHGLTHIVTFNPADFRCYGEITVVTPEEVIRSQRRV